MYKRGQLTIFVILGILLVVTFSSYFLFFSDYSPLDYFKKDMKNPNDYIEDCVSEVSEKIVGNFLSNNFYFEEPETNYFRYNNDGKNEKIPYLCTVGEFYASCINQDPLLEKRIKQSLKEKFEPGIDNCFNKLKKTLNKEGNGVEVIKREIEIISRKREFQIEIDYVVNVIGEEQTQSFSDFKVIVKSRILEFAKLAMTIVNFESGNCAFDLVSWVNANPSIFITRFRGGEQTKLYTLKDRFSDEEIKFAVKTCLLPAGI